MVVVGDGSLKKPNSFLRQETVTPFIGYLGYYQGNCKRRYEILPVFHLVSSFFLSRFETNVKPFQRLGGNDLQCDTTALSSSLWQSPWSATTRIVARPRWGAKKQKSVLPIKVPNLGLQIWNSKI